MLELVRATVAHFDQALAGDPALAAALGCAVAEGWSVWPEQLPQTRAWLAEHPDLGEWGTKLILYAGHAGHTEPRTLIGMGGFRGPPEEGVVEIGYALAPAYRGRGLATAFARMLIDQAFADPRVTSIVAHTLAEVNPSNRLLARLGFKRVRELVDPNDGPVWLWRLQSSDYTAVK